MSLSKLEINLNNLAHNYKIMHNIAQGKEIGSVLKANAYGLGAKQIAQTLKESGCKHFYTATIQEGVELRQIITNAHIYILNGANAGKIEELSKHNLTPVCATWEEVDTCILKNISFLLHIETGLKRLGVEISELTQNSDKLNLCKGFISQLAFSNEKNHPVTQKQNKLMNNLKQQYPNLLISAQNSGGLSHDLNQLLDIMRIGRTLYGSCEANFTFANQLKPVITWKVQILQVKDLKKNEGIGYEHQYIAKKDSKIAILGAGYYDGIHPKANKHNLCAFYQNHHLPFVGKVGMDLSAIDISNYPTLKAGNWVELINHTNTLDQLAQHSNSNPRLILCKIGPRVERIYINE